MQSTIIDSESSDSDDNRNREIDDCIKKRNAFWDMFLNFFLNHNLSLRAIEDAAKLINAVPNSEFHMSETKYTVMKRFCQRIVPIYYLILCKNCEIYKKSPQMESKFTCDECQAVLDTERHKFFVTFDIIYQLKKILEEHWAEIETYQNEENADSVCDISDGFIVKSLRQNNPNNIKLSLLMNTDGIQVSKSSKSTLWPIQFVCNFLPRTIRFDKRFIIVAALHLGNVKPDMLSFFTPIIEEFDKINKDGIEIRINDVELNLNVHLTHCSVDLPAQSIVQGIRQYNGYMSCTTCLHNGVSVKNFSNNRFFVRYVWRGVIERPRTHEEMLHEMDKVGQGQVSDIGINELSCLLPFEQLDLVRAFGVDYMHCILLGVVKSLLEIWFNPLFKKKPFYFNLFARKLLNERILKLKLCSFVSRKIRTLDNRKFFKANEYRTLLIYILPIILRGILHERYYAHFCTLSAAIYELLAESISVDRLSVIEGTLTKFVCDFEKLYGSYNVTMNLHRVLHIVDSVRYCGPLWATSLFHFEGNNGSLIKYISGSQDILMQISFKYGLNAAMNKPKYKIHDDIAVFKSRIAITLTEEQKQLFTATGIELDTESNFRAFACMNYKNEKYTSTNYLAATKCIDYFVKCENQTFAKILFFFTYADTDLMMVQRFEKKTSFYQFVELYNDDEYFDIIEISSIVEKMIYIQNTNAHFLVQRPNKIEKD